MAALSSTHPFESTYRISSIKIVAGEQTLDKQEFRVDETLIRSNSGFFDRGFTRREFLNDDKPEMIKLPKTSAKVFQVIRPQSRPVTSS